MRRRSRDWSQRRPRAAVASWARERADGWSPLRPAWSRPGWFARASTWMVEQMAAVGRPAVGAPRQHQLWGLSVVLRAPSADGDVFFKCTVDLFRREAAVTQALAGLMPDVMPEVLAVDELQGWMLMRDLGARRAGRAGGIAVVPGHRDACRNPAVDAVSYGRARSVLGFRSARSPAWPRGLRR